MGETGGKRQEFRDRRRLTVDVRQETWDIRQETWDRRRETRDMRLKSNYTLCELFQYLLHCSRLTASNHSYIKQIRSRRREEFYPTVFCDTFIGILCILSSFIIFIQLKEESVKILSCLKEKPGRILYWEYCRLVKSSSNESSCRRMSWDFLCQEVGQIENWQRGSLIIWELAAWQLFVCCRTSN